MVDISHSEYWHKSLGLEYMKFQNGRKLPFETPLIIILRNKTVNII